MFSALRTLSSVRAAPIIARRTYATEIPIGQVARVYRMNVNDEATAMKVDAMMAEVRPIILVSLALCSERNCLRAGAGESQQPIPVFICAVHSSEGSMFPADPPT
jgi:hypothetical protein